MLPDFLDLKVDEVHVEMANREFSELELLKVFAEKMDVAVGIIDVKNYYIETVEDVVTRINRCLKYVPAEKLAVAPDCGLKYLPREVAFGKMQAMAAGEIAGAGRAQHTRDLRHQLGLARVEAALEDGDLGQVGLGDAEDAGGRAAQRRQRVGRLVQRQLDF